MSEEHKPKLTLKDEASLRNPDTVVRHQGGKFAPGISANPGGRPKYAAEVRELAQKRSKEAMQLVYGIMVDESQKTSDRLAAIRVILTAAGAMIQVRETSGVKSDELSEISADELKKFLTNADIIKS